MQVRIVCCLSASSHACASNKALLGRLASLWGPLKGVVEQQLLYQVHMRHEHAPAAIPHQAQGIQRITTQQSTGIRKQESWVLTSPLIL